MILILHNSDLSSLSNFDVVVKSRRKNALNKNKICFSSGTIAVKTKMIILTSDGDIIRQSSFNKTKNSHIIELDDMKKVLSNETNNNMINLVFLTDLFQFVRILYSIHFIRIHFCAISIMIKCIKGHSNHSQIVSQNLPKHRRNPSIIFVLHVAIRRLDLIMVFSLMRFIQSLFRRNANQSLVSFFLIFIF